jgi:hypothetical protein
VSPKRRFRSTCRYTRREVKCVARLTLHAVDTYRGAEVMLRVFLTSSLDADDGRSDAPVALSRWQNPWHLYCRRLGSGEDEYQPVTGTELRSCKLESVALLTQLHPLPERKLHLVTLFFSLALQPQFGPWPTSMKHSVSLRFSRS